MSWLYRVFVPAPLAVIPENIVDAVYTVCEQAFALGPIPHDALSVPRHTDIYLAANDEIAVKRRVDPATGSTLDYKIRDIDKRFQGAEKYDEFVATQAQLVQHAARGSAAAQAAAQAINRGQQVNLAFWGTRTPFHFGGRTLTLTVAETRVSVGSDPRHASGAPCIGCQPGSTMPTCMRCGAQLWVCVWLTGAEEGSVTQAGRVLLEAIQKAAAARGVVSFGGAGAGAGAMAGGGPVGLRVLQMGLAAWLRQLHDEMTAPAGSVGIGAAGGGAGGGIPMPLQYTGSAQAYPGGGAPPAISAAVRSGSLECVFEASHLQRIEGRPYMEDKTVAVDNAVGSTAGFACGLFGVVDGHGGSDVASYIRDRFHTVFEAYSTGSMLGGKKVDNACLSA